MTPSAAEAQGRQAGTACTICTPCCAAPLYWRNEPGGAFVYDPPQLKPSSPWWWLRACDLATYPCALCCATLCLSQDLVWDEEQLQTVMQETPKSHASQAYQGFWLMDDNTMPEGVISLDDAEWGESRIVKRARHGWSREPTLIGIMFHVASYCIGGQTIERRENGTWRPRDGYIYPLRNTDRLVDAAGRSIATRPGDMVRVFYSDGEASRVHFMYLLRKLSGPGGAMTGDVIRDVNQCSFSSVWPMLLTRA